MCHLCYNAKKRYTMHRRSGGITQTAGLCLWCYKTRGSSYAAHGWKIAEDIILNK